MKRSYTTELSEVRATFAAARVLGTSDDFVDALTFAGPMVFVGSGGALAAAQLAADLHMDSFRQLSVAMTPLQLAAAPLPPDVGVVLLTSSGRNSDALSTVRAARRRGARHVAVITRRHRDDLYDDIGASDFVVATLQTPPDGFLATNSLFGMVTAIVAASGADLPVSLPAFDNPFAGSIRNSVIALASGRLRSVVSDLEARLVETGLANVQATDYRNFAHGRHVGLQRNIADETVMAFFDKEDKRLAQRTLGLLPKDAHVVRVESPLSWPISALDLIFHSLSTAGRAGADRDMDPGRPGVPEFGRRLYSLDASKLMEAKEVGPVERKLTGSPLRRHSFQAALEKWLEYLHATPIHGIVLDYDGTCCHTAKRFEPPDSAVQQQITRLLSQGATVAFATGRGRSLISDTRTWLPEQYWERVEVGLYNGTVRLSLADDLSQVLPEQSQVLLNAASKISEAFGEETVIEVRSTQLTIVAKQAMTAAFLQSVRNILEREAPFTCKSFTSGHSVDVIEVGGGKGVFYSEISQPNNANLLAIGDQGQIDGNDFELLAATPLSLSVDKCSPDPSRCWVLDDAGLSGPDLLVRYLAALQPEGPTFRFRRGSLDA